MTDLVNSLLGGLLGGGDVTGERLQEEVAEAGGLPFREKVRGGVPRAGGARRLPARAVRRRVPGGAGPGGRAAAPGLRPPARRAPTCGPCARACSRRTSPASTTSGPGKRRLYAVSEDRSFSPMNQIVLVHELRHALQDQYAEPRRVPRRRRLGLRRPAPRVDVAARGRRHAGHGALRAPAPRRRSEAAAEAPAAGDPAAARGARSLRRSRGAAGGARPARAAVPRGPDLRARPVGAGGGEALREAWGRPPAVHRAGPAPREVLLAGGAARRGAGGRGAARRPAACRRACSARCSLRTLVEGAGEAATEGWGGDGWRLWDVGGRTALAWRSEWDTRGRRRGVPRRAASALRAARRGGLARRDGRSSRRERAPLRGAARGRRGRARLRRRRGALRPMVGGRAASEPACLGAFPTERTETDGTTDGVSLGRRSGIARRMAGRLKPGGGKARVPLQPSGPRAEHGLTGGEMATSTPGGAKTNLGLEPNVAGLLCYVPCCVGLVFSVVAAIVEKQSRFVRFHAFQSLLLHAVAIVLGIGINVLQVVLGVAGLGAVGPAALPRGDGGRRGVPRPDHLPDDQGERGRGVRAAGDRADGPPVGRRRLDRRPARRGSGRCPRAWRSRPDAPPASGRRTA